MVGGGHRVAHAGFHEGLVGKRGVDLLLGVGEDLGHLDVAPRVFFRGGGPQQVGNQEVEDGPGFGRRVSGPPSPSPRPRAGPRGPDRLPGAHRRARDQGEADQGRRRQGRPVAPGELARTDTTADGGHASTGWSVR